MAPRAQSTMIGPARPVEGATTRLEGGASHTVGRACLSPGPGRRHAGGTMHVHATSESSDHHHLVDPVRGGHRHRRRRLQDRVHPLRRRRRPTSLGADIPATHRGAAGRATGSGSPTTSRAFAEFDDDGRCVRHGYDGGGVIGATTVAPGPALHGGGRERCPTASSSRRSATAGCASRQTVGRPHRPAGAPPGAARRRSCSSSRPIAWTTLELDAPRRRHGRGPVGRRVAVPAALDLRRRRRRSPPRAGMTDFKDWAGHAFGHHTPWGDEDSPALVTAVETALERELSNVIMRGGAKPPTIRSAGRRRRADRRRASAADELFLAARRRAGGRGRRHELGRGRPGRGRSASGPSWKAATARRRCAP